MRELGYEASLCTLSVCVWGGGGGESSSNCKMPMVLGKFLV